MEPDTAQCDLAAHVLSSQGATDATVFRASGVIPCQCWSDEAWEPPRESDTAFPITTSSNLNEG